MREPGPRPRGRVVVQLGVAGVGRLGRAVRHHRGRAVALAHLHAVRVELVVLELERLAQVGALLRGLRRVLRARGDVLAHELGVAGAEDTERGEDRSELLDALVRPQHDLPADRRALGVVAVEQARARRAAQHVGQLPGEVVGVLDRGVGAQPVARGVPVARVARAEHPPFPVPRGVHLVVAPQRRRPDRHVHGVVAHELVHDLDRLGLVHLRRRLVDVVAPDDQPLVPRPHHAHEAQPDAAHVRAGLQHPVQDARPVRDQVREVGLEDDVHRPRDVHLALEGQVDVRGDLAAAAVGADDVPGADDVLVPGDAVAHGDVDAVVVLHERDVLGVEAHAAPPRRRLPDEDRLQVGLRDVQIGLGAGLQVVGLAGGMGEPGADPAQLVAGQAGAEDGLAHLVVRGALRVHVGCDAEVAEDLHRALVRDVRPGGVGRPAVLRDHGVFDAQGRQGERRTGSGRPAADHQHVGGQVRHDVFSRTMSNSTSAHGTVNSRPSGPGPGSRVANSTTRLSLTPKTASRSRYSSPATKMCVINA